MNSPFIQNRIASARFLVAGCGALGNEVLKNLALMGAGHVTLVDFDRVEQGNLSRSVLYTKADVGSFKVDAAAGKLKEINPAMEIKTICGDVAYDVGLGLIRSMDVVIGCLDSRWARYCINRMCMRAGVPWVDGGIDILEGTVRVFAPGKNCYACNLGPEGLKDLRYRMPCSGTIRRNEEAGHAPTTAISASVIGAVQVQEALKLLHPEAGLTSLCGKMFYYEGAHLSSRLIDFRGYDPECPVHDKWEPVTATAVNPQMPVKEVIPLLCKELDSPRVALHLHADCFVDSVMKRSDDSTVEVMLPGRSVAAFLEQDPELRNLPLSALYQHEYREIDGEFPYQALSLKDLGIPERDVLWVSTPTGDYYKEMI